MTGQAIESGPPRRLFGMRDISAGYKGGRDNDFTFNVYEVSPDGQRFLLVKPPVGRASGLTQINMVLNWFEELKQKVPVK